MISFIFFCITVASVLAMVIGPYLAGKAIFEWASRTKVRDLFKPPRNRIDIPLPPPRVQCPDTDCNSIWEEFIEIDGESVPRPMCTNCYRDMIVYEGGKIVSLWMAETPIVDKGPGVIAERIRVGIVDKSISLSSPEARAYLMTWAPNLSREIIIYEEE